MSPSSLYDLVGRLDTAISNLEKAMEDFPDASDIWSERERIYRKAKSEAFLRSSGRNKEEREANAEECRFGDETLSDIRYRRDLAEGLKVAALENQRSRRAILSAIQSLSNLSRVEAEFARTSP